MRYTIYSLFHLTAQNNLLHKISTTVHLMWQLRTICNDLRYQKPCLGPIGYIQGGYEHSAATLSKMALLKKNPTTYVQIYCGWDRSSGMLSVWADDSIWWRQCVFACVCARDVLSALNDHHLVVFVVVWCRPRYIASRCTHPVPLCCTDVILASIIYVIVHRPITSWLPPSVCQSIRLCSLLCLCLALCGKLCARHNDFLLFSVTGQLGGGRRVTATWY